MPAFLVSLFGSLAGFFGQWMSKKLALGSAAVAVFATLTLAFTAAILALLGTFAHALPDDVAPWVGYTLPSNFAPWLSAVISAKLARMGYDWHVENLKLMAYFT